jgi:EmrB/QacA subfamily drug resistance transporter
MTDIELITAPTDASAAAPVAHRPSRIPRVHLGRWAALPVLMAGTFMVVLDFFIVNVALPSIQADLHAGASAIEWVVAGYGVTLAGGLITAGRIGDGVGRRRTFMVGLAAFTLASAACGLAPNPDALVVARLLQGAAAALISPSVLAIIGVVYTGTDRVRAISVYGMVMGLAAAGGQLLGGALVQADVAGTGWRSVFLINLPVGIVALLVAPVLVPESRAERGNGLDGLGLALLTAGLVAVVLPLVEGRQQGWPAWTWLSLGAAPLVFVAFIIQQRYLRRRGGAPLLDPDLFRERAFAAGNLTQLVFWGGQASFFLVLALYLQQGLGLGPLRAGAVFTILAAAYLAASVRAPRLTLRFGRRLITAGAGVLGAGHLLLLVAVAEAGPGGSIALLAPGLTLVGAGMGLCITPLVSTVLSSVRPERAGVTSGALSTMQQVGNALGVAVTGVIFFGALPEGYARAFELSVAQLAALLLTVAALTRLLPGRSGVEAAR